ncbi:uncharacterized protein BXZ73DRAFT_77275 [Epithele typhae]|uniref:uncharacterized protein n=1 Tax=Epithele typhae TaxID=378194 RepID=UPI002008E772|nr:uncharacterized protein BXZ73DRAFT_77275 [Epithele typhae]KAH9933674.1 hypothetical protein BXZ73DRAFT_77275 [Epithele typhae]
MQGSTVAASLSLSPVPFLLPPPPCIQSRGGDPAPEHPETTSPSRVPPRAKRRKGKSVSRSPKPHANTAKQRAISIDSGSSSDDSDGSPPPTKPKMSKTDRKGGGGIKKRGMTAKEVRVQFDKTYMGWTHEDILEDVMKSWGTEKPGTVYAHFKLPPEIVDDKRNPGRKTYRFKCKLPTHGCMVTRDRARSGVITGRDLGESNLAALKPFMKCRLPKDTKDALKEKSAKKSRQHVRVLEEDDLEDEPYDAEAEAGSDDELSDISVNSDSEEDDEEPDTAREEADADELEELFARILDDETAAILGELYTLLAAGWIDSWIVEARRLVMHAWTTYYKPTEAPAVAVPSRDESPEPGALSLTAQTDALIDQVRIVLTVHFCLLCAI